SAARVLPLSLGPRRVAPSRRGGVDRAQAPPCRRCAHRGRQGRAWAGAGIGHVVGVGREPREKRDPSLRTHAERLVSRDGYFPPGSVIRRVGNSPLTPFLGGGPAVLLQVAHPLVAAGVVRHSDYRRDLWRRLVRTLRALYLIAFGTTAEAERAGAAGQAVRAR